MFNHDYHVSSLKTLKAGLTDGQFLYTYSFSWLKCALIYEPGRFKGFDLKDNNGESFCYTSQHVSFYALTEGWDDLTETGYKSFFIFDYSDLDAMCEDELINWFKTGLKQINFKYPSEYQLSLF